jgi:hypothetical protein
MTTAIEAIKAIQQQFAAGFSGAQIAYDNEPPVERDAEFVRLSIQLGNSTPNLDSSFERTTGVAFISAIVPKGVGDIRAWALAKDAADVLRYKTFGGVRLTSASYTNVGIIGDALEQDSGWYQINVSIPFWFEHYEN